MDKHLINTFHLEANPNDQTPLDKFKLFRNFDVYLSTLHDYASKHELNELEQYYYKIETDPRRRFFYNVSQTYFDNYFLAINFLLTNPYVITTPTFTNLYNEKNLLLDLADHIIELYKTLDDKACKYFNKFLLDKFIANLDFIPLPDDVTGEEYKIYFSLFKQATNRLKTYLIELVKDPKWLEHSEEGLSQFEPEIYQFYFEYNTGLKINSSNDFIKIKQWAQKHLDHLMDEVNQTCDRLLTNNEDKTKSVYNKMILVGKDSSQQWLSKQEMIDAFEACIAKNRHIFINQYQFKEFNPPGLIILDNPLLAKGYHDKDKFFLNVCNWKNGEYKYSVENLTLHECVPGHHLQFDISYHSPYNNYLTTVLNTPCKGFTEGWGLFAEHLDELLVNNPWIYFGYLQANILRVFRIIADIHLHVEGHTPQQVIQLAKQYLTASEEWITMEVYRYRILPGQACSYKIGLEVFKRIIKKKFNVDDINDYLRPDLIEWYKDVLWKTERPLDILLRENGITWSFDE
ncbi:unnamed protein product [Adineta steineri]|uniref:DUF885 domain-containing protein n=1 Tax=Adineta steineri TaxID=433720 RepID=A0A815N2S3_9BILA|nr:unnamed protein product [Adineta steineri]